MPSHTRPWTDLEWQRVRLLIRLLIIQSRKARTEGSMPSPTDTKDLRRLCNLEEPSIQDLVDAHNALPGLLDRLEKLERVRETAASADQITRVVLKALYRDWSQEGKRKEMYEELQIVFGVMCSALEETK
jgi:hypothetical protein